MASSALIKSLENIMRIDDGVDGDSQYIGQVTWMLFLKAFDAKEMEWEFKPDYKGIIPEGYRWRDWADDKEGITGDALIKFINELFDKLKNLDTSDGDMRKFVVKNVFTDINNYMKSGIQLRKLINAINEKVDFNDAREKHTFNDLYEGMLKDLQSSGNAGEYYTPRPVTNFIVEKVDPKLGEIVLDPACGTGGFLTSTIAHFGSIESTEDLQKLQTSINGWEKKPLPFLLAMTNLILHDIEIPNLKHINSLNRPYTDYSEVDRVDVVVANPPFGGSEDAAVKNNFPSEFQTSETADLFMALIMNLLKDKGRCGIVLPDGFMFGDGVKANIKEKLLKEYGLHTIIRLPQVFKPYANVNTNLLFFQKGVESKGVWFYRLDYPEGVKSFTKTKPMEDKHFDPVREWWDNKKTIMVDGKDKARFFKVEELDENGLNYDFDKCCPFPHEEEEILEPTELIAHYQAERSELNNTIDNAICYFSSIYNGVETDINFIPSDAISKLTTLNSEFTSKLRKSVLQQAIQGKLTEQYLSDEPASKLLARIRTEKAKLIAEGKIKKEKPVSPITDEEKPFDIPDTWEWVRINQISSFVTKGTTPRGGNVAYKSSGIGFLRAENIGRDGKLHLDNMQYIDEATHNGYLQRSILVKDDLIVTIAGSLGRTAIVTADALPLNANQAISFIRWFDTNNVFVPYIQLAIDCPQMQRIMIGKSKATGVPNLTLEIIGNTLIPMPPLAEQKRIVARVEELLAVCDNLK